MVLRRSLALFVATAMMMVMMAVSRAFVQPGGVRIAAERPTGVRKTPTTERALGNCRLENNPLFLDARRWVKH